MTHVFKNQFYQREVDFDIFIKEMYLYVLTISKSGVLY